MKEIDYLMNELPFMAKNILGEGAEVDLDQVTIMGHGFGATSAILAAAKDSRIKKLISYDPYLIPLSDMIK